MSLAHLVIHAALRGFADALGVSGTAHALALGLWVPAPEMGAFAGAAGAGTALAVVAALRGRLGPALAEGMQVIGRSASLRAAPRAREALTAVWMALVSGTLGLVLVKAGAAPPGPVSAQTVAIGLGVTGAALLGGAWISGVRGDMGRRGRKASGGALRGGALGGAGLSDAPSRVAATLSGAAHAFGVWPGVSRVGVAAAALMALGIRPARAMELGLLATVPFFCAEVFGAGAAGEASGKGQVLAVGMLAFCGAWGAIAALRSLAARKAIAALPLWMLPLAGAIFAFGRAVQGP
jgi:undecaprenyl pyrophosphate phosphatase UppP